MYLLYGGFVVTVDSHLSIVCNKSIANKSQNLHLFTQPTQTFLKTLFQFSYLFSQSISLLEGIC